MMRTTHHHVLYWSRKANQPEKGTEMGRKKMTNEKASVVMFAAGLTPLVEYPGNKKPWLCRHEVCGREVTPRRSNIASGDGGCGFCAGNVVDDPSEVMIAAGLTPLVEYPGNGTPWLCRHEVCGREVTPRRNDIVTGRGGCKFCAGHVVDDHSEVMLAAGLTPLVEYPGNMKPWLCRHDACGREVTPRRANITRGEGGCKFCAGNVVDDPSAVMLAAGYTPLHGYPGNNEPWLCRHDACGREVTPRRGDINSGKGGCSACADHGYDASKAGYFYAAHMGSHDLTGFGISNDAERRLSDYRSAGTLDAFDALFTGTGAEIARFEAELKVLVRELGEIDSDRPNGFKTESLAGNWVDTLTARAKRAGLVAA